MSLSNRTIFACLGVIGLALVGTGALVIVNWRTISKNLTEALATSSERTQTTLFRWGELMSLGAELKRQYGAEPDVTYDTSTSVRTLGIRFSSYQSPEQVTTDRHAREIAAFAIGRTKKFEQIDVVRVQFQGSGPYSFALDDLMPGRPR
jgi:hypothetical protein